MRLPSLTAHRLLPLLLVAGCATAPQRPSMDLGTPEQFAESTADWERIAIQAEAWPTPGEGGTVGVADRLTDGEKGARVFATAAGTRAPWTFVFRFRGSHPAPAAVVIETPLGAGCRPSDLSLFLNSSRGTLDRSSFTRFIESSQRVGFAELKGKGGRYLLTLPFDADAAQVWGRLRVPHPEHELDKQIAAIALIHDLTVVTRNCADFEGTGVKVLNPFSGAG